MQKSLFWIGTILAGFAGILSFASIDSNHVDSTAAVGVGVAAIAFIYASRNIPE